MKQFRWVGLVWALVALAGCAPQEGYREIVQTWIGNSADELVQAWGPPTSSYQLDSGGHVLQYDRSRTVSMGGYTTLTPVTTYSSGTVYSGGASGNYSGSSTSYVPVTTPSSTFSVGCVTRFRTSPSGYIEAVDFDGSDCRG
jgi:hypothetical protein